MQLPAKSYVMGAIVSEKAVLMLLCVYTAPHVA